MSEATLDPHAARIASLRAAFDSASSRFLARFDAATDGEATRTPPSGGWTPAQIAAHVAALNRLLAAIVSGRIERAAPPSSNFVERPWAQVAAGLRGPLVAPEPVRPPAEVTRQEARSVLLASTALVLDTLASLDRDRARFVFTDARTGSISLYQIAEWLTAHVARHNAQLKKVLGR